MICKDWEVKKLKDCALIYDSLHQTPEYSGFGYPMVRVTDIREGYLNLLKCVTKKDDILKQLSCFGISKMSLYPELYKFAEYIKEKYK